MKGDVVSVGFLTFSLIVIALLALVLSLPAILRGFEQAEWAELKNRVRNIHKYDDERITFTLPVYVERIEFIQGNEEVQKCETPPDLKLPRDLLAGVCSGCANLEGNTYITIKIDQKSKSDLWSVLGKFATSGSKEAKAEAMKMVLSDLCYPKDFKSSFEDPGGKLIHENYEGLVMVLPGDRNNVKSYCVNPRKDVGRTVINVQEGGCQ
ncbi:MAG: hypothetical protein V3U72_05110 [Candidatus Aenigmarchaeota archaeon]